ncbi:hypothetical protein WJX72_012563 [[Myrmecia] bisecta]|uniref:AP2/ERF domain-containing protein n=1 Tax=[Myrmecia] bisecta TaxID=41462 RepID=A0AAW1QTF2_9CHLO
MAAGTATLTPPALRSRTSGFAELFDQHTGVARGDSITRSMMMDFVFSEDDLASHTSAGTMLGSPHRYQHGAEGELPVVLSPRSLFCGNGGEGGPPGLAANVAPVTPPAQTEDAHPFLKQAPTNGQQPPAASEPQALGSVTFVPTQHGSFIPEAVPLRISTPSNQPTTRGSRAAQPADSGSPVPTRGPGRPTRRSRERASEERTPRVKNRSSQFRGVTKHRRSGRWEAHIWVKELGRQVYLGGYEHEDHAAEAYDVAALKYADLTECMDSISLEELIMAVRRQSQGFSRGTSSFRGVTHHPSGRWEARIGIPGSKHIYLGLFNNEKEAAQAYDRALVRLRGTAAATNFALSDYRSHLADYHKMQQTVLLSEDGMAKLMSNSADFEKWIKHGTTDGETQPNSEDALGAGDATGESQPAAQRVYATRGRGTINEDEAHSHSHTESQSAGTHHALAPGLQAS